MLPLINKRATLGQCSFNCILSETEKPSWLIYSHPCKKPTQISGLTHLPSKTSPILSEASKKSGHYSKLHPAACYKLQNSVGWCCLLFAHALSRKESKLFFTFYGNAGWAYSSAHAVSYKISFIILYNLQIQLILTCKLSLPTSPSGHCVLADVATCQLCRSGKDSFPRQTASSGLYRLEIVVSLTKLLIANRFLGRSLGSSGCFLYLSFLTLCKPSADHHIALLVVPQKEKLFNG